MIPTSYNWRRSERLLIKRLKTGIKHEISGTKRQHSSKSRQHAKMGDNGNAINAEQTSTNSANTTTTTPNVDLKSNGDTIQMNRNDIQTMMASMASTMTLTITEVMANLGFSRTTQPTQIPSDTQYAYNASKMIPDFDPKNDSMQTMERWLHKVDEYASIYGWSDKVTASYALPKLIGTAKTWYEGLSSVQLTWLQWKDILKKSFPETVNPQKRLRDMQDRTRQHNETIEDYFYDKVGKLRRCGIPENDMCEFIITGLNDTTLAMMLGIKQYNTPEELLEDIKRLEERKLYMNSQQKPDFGGRNLKTTEKGKNFDTNNKQDRVNYNQNSIRQPRKMLTNEKGESLCFNCSEYGHLSLVCPKPQRRKRCNKCQRVGHFAKDCRVRANSSPVLTSTRSETLVVQNECNDNSNVKYFHDARINGHEIRSYVDFGSRCVLLRKSDADTRQLKYDPVEYGCTLGGYGAGKIIPCGQLKAEITVDQATATSDIYVVPDDAQVIPLLIGQPFTEQSHVTVIKRGNTIRIFQEKETQLDDSLKNLKVPELPQAKINLWAKEAAVIPKNHVAFIDVYTKEKADHKNVYVEARMRLELGREHCVPRCIVAVNEQNHSIVPVVNVSNNDIKIQQDDKIARAEYCHPEENHLQVLRVEATQLEPIQIEDINVGPNVTAEDTQLLFALINRYRDCFAQNLRELGATKMEMEIELVNDKPITFRPYRLSHSEREKVRGMIDELKETGLVVESASPYASPILVVKKKTGDERLCIDYRALNKVTKKDKYPLPLIDDQMDRLQGNYYFTSLDMASGYYQVKIGKESQEKTAFITPDGHYEFTRMPFGLTNAPAVYQRIINTVLGPLRFTTAMAYMDDILLPSRTISEGMSNLEQILQVLREAGLTLKLKKCFFLSDKVEYLGFEISSDGIKPGNRKIEAVKDFPVPVNVHQVRQFMGLASYFRRFISGFATIAHPITILTWKDKPWQWEDEQHAAFTELRTKLSERPVLGLYHNGAQTEVHTDASQHGLGAVLLQEGTDCKLHPIAYASRQTTKEERKYHSSELETLAVVWSLDKFRVYLLGICFKVVTDCNAVRGTITKKDIAPRIGRWWLRLQEYNFEVEHRPGKSMAHVDALSRSPFGNPEETEIVDTLQILAVDVSVEDWLVVIQRSDPYIQGIHDQLNKVNNVTKDDIRAKEEFEVQHGRLFHRMKTDANEIYLHWVVPKRARWQIVKRCHDDVGHFGLDKTLGLVKKKFWFPRMKRYVKRYISACLECLYHKSMSGKKPGMLHSIDKIGEPFHTIHMDHLGPFVKSKKRNKYIIVMVDAFTKYVMLRAAQSTQTGPAVRFLEDIIGLFGPPVRIITDQGTSYTSKVFESCCSRFNITHVKNSTATPRANGQVERYNRMITPSLASMCKSEDGSDWDKWLNRIQWGINNTVHKATQRSPFGLLLNFSSRSLDGSGLDVAIDQTFNEEALGKRRIAIEAIRADQHRQRIRYNVKRAKATVFEPGDMVVVERDSASTGTSQKLSKRYKGPYVISKCLPNDRYVIEDMPEKQLTQRFYRNTAPVDKLKRWQVLDESDSSNSDNKCDDDECAESSPSKEENTEIKEAEPVPLGKRKTKPPVWLKDYNWSPEDC